MSSYAKPAVQRYGAFRDLTQYGCSGTTDLTIPGIGSTVGNIPEIVKVGGKKTMKICFANVSGF